MLDAVLILEMTIKAILKERRKVQQPPKNIGQYNKKNSPTPKKKTNI